MRLNNIRIVLVNPSHPGNIGSTARAMRTMGLTRLYLVSPQAFPHPQAQELAAGADDVLAEAVVTDTLATAIGDCHFVFATSARRRELALPGLEAAAAAKFALASDPSKEYAFVFGRERTGLSNEELLQCHYHIHIPTDEAFASLNLAQAVQIIAYELRVNSLSTVAPLNSDSDMATMNELEQFYTHLHEVLIDIDFLKPSNPKKLMQRLRRLFNRTKLEEKEVHILRGILTQVQKSLAGGKNDL
jgi:tRNA (cytidine32/uridine32-2'-O)-methyltransferase